MNRISNDKLMSLGFELSPLVKEDFMFYQTSTYDKDGSYIAVTTEFEEDGSFSKQIFTINDRDLMKTLSFKKLDLLIEILFDKESAEDLVNQVKNNK